MSVAGTYGEALYEAASDGGALAAVASDLDGFRALLGDSEELRTALSDPEVELPARKRVVEQLTADANPLLTNFLLVLLDRDRLGELTPIAEAFAARVAEAEGRIAVHAVTAVPLSDDLRQRIVERVRDETGRVVDLTESVEHDIIGGLVLSAGSVVMDASVREQLRDLRSTLVAAPVEAAVGA